MTFEIGNYRIEAGLGSLRPWTHFRLHRSSRWFDRPWTRHIVWGRLSIHVDTPDICTVQVCPHCHGETRQMPVGDDDGITYCAEGCGCIEGDPTKYITVREYERGIE